MASTSTILRAARPMFRQNVYASPARQAFVRATQQQHRQQVMRFRFQNRRWQSSEAGAGGAGSQQQQQSWFKRMWESEIGIKTVHFWAPVMKVRFIYLMPAIRGLKSDCEVQK